MAPSILSVAAVSALLLSHVLGTSTSAATTASSTALAANSQPSGYALVCPAADQVTYVSGNVGYQIECGSDRYNNDVGLVYTSTFDDCIRQCNGVPNCVDVSYLPGTPGPCYLKNGAGYVNRRSDVWGARALNTTHTALNCPFSNGVNFTTNAGQRTWAIECDTDHFDSDYKTNPQYVQSLEQCIGICDGKIGCQTAVLSGTVCYLKFQTNPGFTKQGLSGARCIDGCWATISPSQANGP